MVPLFIAAATTFARLHSRLSIRRPRLVRALPLALHPCAALSFSDLCRLLLVGPQRNHPGCFFLGRLAWDDADLRFLSHLRCENRLVRWPQSSARLLALRNLVCSGGRVVANADDGHIGRVLFQRRALHSAVDLARNATWLCFSRTRCLHLVRGEFCLDVDAGEAT